MQSLMDEIRRNAEKEKSEQLETFKEKNKQLSSTIESLQKELADRFVCSLLTRDIEFFFGLT